ncbi:inositol hexakisphosphate kinase/inositol pyrophosphate synthase [Endogone sp. FLAS-F59071]|nr:inositol hexakisphosphate kinase/inositol pyrophosphate synthase [Endogone sp. FLAS-F59071]|eukprot:RUS15211.1 inositol hexakisphosphate kinase/inositol pyrophosphate synthase [Endogone sp. FLAS-F59071]
MDFPKPSLSPPSKPKFVVGVCAMDSKARSRPMHNILNRMMACGEFETVIFGDKVILDEDVENWPGCDFFISFFSTGFPLDKATHYVNLRKPYAVNDLAMQECLLDRRVVLSILDAVNVPTPRRLTISRDGGPHVNDEARAKVLRNIGIDVCAPVPEEEFVVVDQDTISVGGKIMKKPFVEKPVDGEDHRIHIYYDTTRGGGSRKLFRKTLGNADTIVPISPYQVANKSSEFDPNLTEPRMDGSYIYEEFMDVDNAEDVKVYTLGPTFTHAETRKSPVVDGHVRRNTDGKEVRYITELTDIEKEMARKVCVAFGQTVCGFDLLRVAGKSYVIDVNGWSFVKGNDHYYDNAARILREMFLVAGSKRKVSVSYSLPPELQFENSWRLKAFVSVFRHADRTPKQKMKFLFTSEPFIELLEGATEEVILRQAHQLALVSAATIRAIAMGSEDATKLLQLKEVLDKKSDLLGTKVQLKPTFGKDDGRFEKLQLIVKWGGEFTHAARYQSRDLGENLRKDMIIMNKNVLDDVKVYTSSERRVITTADIFAYSFLGTQVLPPHFLKTSKELLDDSNAAKEQMDAVKLRLRQLLRSDHMDASDNTRWRGDLEEPAAVVREVVEMMRRTREVMRRNLVRLDVDALQSRWCCSESPMLFRERWEKLFKDFCDVHHDEFDPSKVSELYDSMKYDALHNRAFVEAIFVDPTATEGEQRSLEGVKELYRKAKAMFDFVAPQEYGISHEEKMEIGLLTSLPLLKKIIGDLEGAKNAENPCTRLYFTKESHVHTLLNVVFLSGLPTRISRTEIAELDYLTQITFELYERNRTIGGDKEYSLRVGFSPGAHDPNILDLQMDAKHCLSVAPRKNLTDHLPLDEALSFYRRHLNSPGVERIERQIVEKRYHYAEEDDGDDVADHVVHQLEQIAGEDVTMVEAEDNKDRPELERRESKRRKASLDE